MNCLIKLLYPNTLLRFHEVLADLFSYLYELNLVAVALNTSKYSMETNATKNLFLTYFCITNSINPIVTNSN